MTFDAPRRGFMRHGLAVALATPALLRAAVPAWPAKSVRMVVGLAPGGLSDTIARAYCNELQLRTKQTFVVENKAGAGSILACQEIARAAPDGYNLLYTIQTALIQNPVLYSKLPYDPARDFTPLVLLLGAGMPFCVHPSLPVKDVPGFLAWAKGRPVNLGTYAAGSYPHMFVALINKRYGLNVEAVHYKGENPMWQDVAGGSLHCAIGSYSGVLPRLQANSVRPIGLMGKKRLPKLPDLPTFAEQGLAERQFSLSIFHAMLGPAGMAPELRDLISQSLVDAGRGETVSHQLDVAGSDMTVDGWRAYEQLVREEGPLIQAVLRDLGVKLD